MDRLKLPVGFQPANENDYHQLKAAEI